MFRIREKLLHYLNNPYNIFYGLCTVFIIFGFLHASPVDIWKGLVIIVQSPDILITDYIEIAGLGAAFINSALVMMLTVLLMSLCGHVPTRYSIMSLMLASGFAFFGKNPANMLPILAGGYLYSIYAREPFKKYVMIAILGTTLSPAVTQIALVNFSGRRAQDLGIAAGAALGIFIGFIIEPLAKYSPKSHEGYNLYNVGFAAGILSVVIMSVMRNFGLDFTPVNILSSGNDEIIVTFILCISAYLLIVGVILSGSLKKSYHIIISRDYHVANFHTYMSSQEYLEMGLLGVLVIGFVWILGVDLSGPIIGGIFTIMGFSCCGKTIANIVPIMLGATIAGYLGVREVDTTSVVMAILFSTGLSPIAEKYGWFWGTITGFLHMTVALNIGFLNGGLNLYNNGLAGGFVVMTLVPIIQAYSKHNKKKLIIKKVTLKRKKRGKTFLA